MMHKKQMFFVLRIFIFTLAFAPSRSMLFADTNNNGIRQLTTDTVIPELWSIESISEVISSKIDEAPYQVTSELWSIESKAEFISSKIDIPEPCTATPITTSGIISGKSPIAIHEPTVLSDSGYYCLAQDIDTTNTDIGIAITGSTVTLDLNGYTVKNGTIGINVTGNDILIKNGTISGMSDTGIILQNAHNCRIEHVDTNNAATGFLLNNSGANMLFDCRALASTSAGFSLVSSYTNTITKCQALNTLSLCNAFGFISRNGANNIFSACTTQGIKTSSNAILDIQGWALATSGAFVLVGDERNSHIINCTAQETSTPTAGHNAAYGIWLTSGAATSPLELTLTTSTAIAGNVLTTAWLVKGTTTYLALGGSDTTRIKIFKFDPTSSSTLDLIASSTIPDGSVSSIAWLSDGDSTYLASGGEATTAPHDHELMVFKFDPLAATLELKASSTAPDGKVHSVAWLVDGTTSYLAAGGEPTSGSSEVKIFEFTGSSLDQKATTTAPDGTVLSVAWLVDGDTRYLATGGLAAAAPNNNEIKVFEFTGSSLIQKAKTAEVNSSVFSVNWLIECDHIYLAAATGILYSPAAATGILYSPTARAYVFEFTGSDLIKKAESPDLGQNITSLSWLSTDTSHYLASGGFTPTNAITLMQFDPASSVLAVKTIVTPDNPVWSVNWLAESGSAYLASGETTNLSVLQLGTINSPHGCMITNNTISATNGTMRFLNRVGENASGIGIAVDSSVNYVAHNTSCNNDINYQHVDSAYVSSQANARGVANVDCSLTSPDEVAQIANEAWSIESKTEIISSKIDIIVPALDPELWSIESKAEIISSKCDSISTIANTIDGETWSIESKSEIISSQVDILVQKSACESVPLHQSDIGAPGSTYTINSSGNYCLAENITGTINITAPNVCLDLNCRELTGILTISAEDSAIQNGKITAPIPVNNSDASNPAIAITSAGTRTQLHNIAIICLYPNDLTTADNGINGRSAITNSADNVQINNCQIQAGNGQGLAITSSGAITINGVNTGFGGTGVNNSGAAIQITDCSIIAGNSGQIYAKGTDSSSTISIDGTLNNFGGSGIINTGAKMQLTNCTVSAGNSGQLYANANSDINIGNSSGSTIEINVGGTAITNSGIETCITNCQLTAGNSGQLYATSFSGNIFIGSNTGSVTMRDGGFGVNTSGNATQLSACVIYAGNSDQIYAQANDTVYIAYDGNVTIDNGGTGIACTGDNTHITDCTVVAGNGGQVYTQAGLSRIAYEASISSNLSVGMGGTGITNQGNNAHITACSITGGSSGNIQAQSATIGFNGGIATLAMGGSAVQTKNTAYAIINNCILMSGDGGSLIGSSFSGNVSGANGGIGIICDNSNNVAISNCLIEKTGNGSNGLGTGSFGGNGGIGILVNSNCSATQISNCTITQTGTGGTGVTTGVGGHGIVSSGASGQINNNTIAYTGSANGLAISCVDSLAPVVYSNFAHNISASPAYYLIAGAAVDSTTGGTAFGLGTDRLANIHKP